MRPTIMKLLLHCFGSAWNGTCTYYSTRVDAHKGGGLTRGYRFRLVNEYKVVVTFGRAALMSGYGND